MKQHQSDEPLFRFLDIDVTEVSEHPRAIAEMLRGDGLNGLIIRNVYSREAMATIAERLDHDALKMKRTAFTKSKHLENPPHVLGNNLVGKKDDLSEYFADAAKYREDTRALFSGLADFEQRIEEALGTLSGGLPIRIPEGPEPGQLYTPSTGRMLVEGFGIKTHVGNSFFDLPWAQHLASIVGLEKQLSYFLTVKNAPAGGELVVYSLEWEDVKHKVGTPDTDIRKHEVTLDGNAADYVESHESMAFLPNEGDVLIFDGGRYFHQVMPARGGFRRTIGGFLAYGKDHESIYIWS